MEENRNNGKSWRRKKSGRSSPFDFEIERYFDSVLWLILQGAERAEGMKRGLKKTMTRNFRWEKRFGKFFRGRKLVKAVKFLNRETDAESAAKIFAGKAKIAKENFKQAFAEQKESAKIIAGNFFVRARSAGKTAGAKMKIFSATALVVMEQAAKKTAQSFSETAGNVALLYRQFEVSVENFSFEKKDREEAADYGTWIVSEETVENKTADETQPQENIFLEDSGDGDDNDENAGELVALSEISKESEYKKGYLVFEARLGKLKARKIDGVWCTTRKWLAQFTHEAQERKEEIRKKLSGEMGGGVEAEIFSYRSRKANLHIATAFIVLLFFVSAANANFETLGVWQSAASGKIATAYNGYLDNISSGAEKISSGLASVVSGFKVSPKRMAKISRSKVSFQKIRQLKKDTGLSLTGDVEKQKTIAEIEIGGTVAGETNQGPDFIFSDYSSENYSGSDAASIPIATPNNSFVSSDIGEHAITRWNLNSNAVNSRKIVDYSIESRDLSNNAVNSRAIQNNSIQSEDLAQNIEISGSFNTLDMLTVGNGATSHSLGESGDAFVSNRFEVDGAAYFDSTLYVKNASSLSTLTSTTLATNTANISNILSNSNLAIRGRLPDEDTFSIYEFTTATINPSGLTMVGEPTPVELDTDAKKEHSLVVKNNLEVQGTIYGTVAGAFTPSGNLDMNGNVITNIGAVGTDFTLTGGLTLADNLALGANTLTTSNQTLVSNLNADFLDGQHGNYYQPLLTNPVTGTGAAGYLTRWATSSTVGSSVIFDDGTNVGIGTTSPLAHLEVAGVSAEPVMGSPNGVASVKIGSDNLAFGYSTNYNWMQSYGNLPLYINPLANNVIFNRDGSGRVGIGTTNPGVLLDVNGAIKLSGTDNIILNGNWLSGDGGDEGVYVSTTGNVGIGTDSVSYRLRVSGTTSLYGNVTIGGSTDLVNNSLTGIGTLRAGSLNNTIIFQASDSTERMRISSTGLVTIAQNLTVSGTGNSSFAGNVGIGTTNPLYKLEVNGTGYFSGAVTYGGGMTASGNILPSADDSYTLGDDTHRWADIFLGPGSLHIGTSIADGYTMSYDTDNERLGFNYQNSGNPEIVFNASGNVGIGTTNPQRQLEIYTTNDSANTPLLRLSNYSSSGKGTGIEFYHPSASQLTGVITNTFDGTAWTMYLGTYQNNQTVTLRSGNIGIGTTNPGYALDVAGRINGSASYGTGAFTVANYSSSYGSAQFRGTWNSSGYYGIGPLSGSSDNTVRIGNTDTNGAWNGTQNLNLVIGGNVGIGTTNPSVKLQVVGQSGTGNIGVFNVTGFDSFGQSLVMQLPSTGYTGNLIALMKAAGGSGQAMGFSTHFSNDAVDNFSIMNHSGAEKFTVLDGGNVGIGTTNPGALLHIGTNTSLPNPLRIDNNAGNEIFGVSYSGSNGVAWLKNSAGTSNIYLQASGNSYFNGGNVGIGTTSPGVKLEVVGDGLFGGVAVGGGRTLSIISSNNNVALYLQNNSTSGYWGVVSGLMGLFDSSGVPALTYSPTSKNVYIYGNVGIGTTNPLYKLEVQGTGYFSGAVTYGGGLTVTGNILPSADDTYTLGDDTHRWADLFLGPGSLHIGTSIADGYTMSYDTDNERLGFNYQNSGNPEIVFNASGNVGIGTTNPGYALDVNGTAHATIGAFGNVPVAGYDMSVGVNGMWLGGVGRINWNAGNAQISNPSSTGRGSGYELAFSTYNGSALTEKMTVTSLGNVGIGTTNPSGLLHIDKSQDANTQVFLTNANTGTSARSEYSFGEDTGSNRAFFGYGNTNFNLGAGYELLASKSAWFGTTTGITNGVRIIAAANAPIILATGGYATANERMRITGTGNVGIGTTSPTQLFSVGANVGGYSAFTVNNSGTTVIGPYNQINATPVQLVFGGYQTSGTTRASIVFNGPGNWIGLGQAATSGNHLRLGGTGVGGDWPAFGTYPIDLSIDGGLSVGTAAYPPSNGLLVNGNVGIGTTSPGVALSVKSSNPTVAEIVSGNASNSMLRFASNSGTNYAYIGALTSSGGFGVWDTNGSTNLLAVKSGGNVGIGTTAPLNLVDIVKDGGAAYVQTTAYRDSNYGGGFTFRHARGTVAVPTILNASDYTFVLQGWGYDGSSFQNNGNIYFSVDGTPSAGSMPGRIIFATTPTGSTTAVTNMVLNQAGLLTLTQNLVVNGTGNSSFAGNVGIGTTNPAYILDVSTTMARISGVYFTNGEVRVSSINHPSGTRISSNAAWIVNNNAVTPAVTSLTVKSTASQTAGLFEWQTSGGVPLGGIDVAGNVGIGTTNPGAALDVVGNVKVTSTTFPVMDIYRDSLTAAGGIYGGAKITRLMTGGTSVNGTGVGFYFYAPNSAGTSITAGMFGGALSTVAAGSTVGELVFASSFNNDDPWNNRHLTIRAVDATNGEVRIPYRLALGADASPLKPLDVTGDAIISGNVGIGTTNPSVKLEVNGGVMINGIPAGYGIVGIKQTSNTYDGGLTLVNSTVGASARWWIGADNVQHIYNMSDGTGKIALGESGARVGVGYDSTSLLNGSGALLINGNVGIGTTSPGAGLHVGAGTPSRSPGSDGIYVKGTSEFDGLVYFDYNLNLNANLNMYGGKLVLYDDRPLGFGGGGGTQDVSMGWNSADNTLRIVSGTDISIAANTWMTLNSGNVGIGTTNPGNKLTISGGVGIGTTAPGSLYLSTRAPDGGLIVEGNVGIGTTSPGALIDVGGYGTPNWPSAIALFKSNANAVASLEMTNTNTGTAADLRFQIIDTTGNYIAFTQPSVGNTAAATFGLARSSASFIYNNGGTARDIAIGTISDKNLILGTNNLERVRISNGGNVGIGTTNPGYLLDINGNAGSTSGLRITNLGTATYGINMANSGLTADDNHYFLYASSQNYWKANGWIGAQYGVEFSGGNAALFGNGSTFSVASGTYWTLMNYGTSNVTLSKFNGTVSSFTGNVGIGTTNPGNKLTISGGVGIGTTAPGSLYLSTRAPDGGLIVEGNVGIGTTNPLVKLDIASNSAAGPVFAIRGMTSQVSYAQFYTPGATNAFSVSNINTDANPVIKIGTDHAFQLMVGSGKPLYLGAGGVVAWTLSSAWSYFSVPVSIGGYTSSGTAQLAVNGNVGIGTTNPAVSLQTTGRFAAGSSQVSLPAGAIIGMVNDASTTFTGAGGNVLTAYNLNTTDNSGAALEFVGLKSGSMYGYGKIVTQIPDHTAETGNMQFWINQAEAMRITGGNVGIGTTNPDTAKFHISSDTASTASMVFSDTGGSGSKWQLTPSGTGVGRGKFGFYAETIEGVAKNQWQMIIDGASGNVGIGTTNPGRKLFVNGDAGGTTGWYNDSDANLKKSVVVISGALQKVMSLRGVSYEWKDPTRPAGEHIGFIAQEVQPIVPEVVSKGGQYYGLDYSSLVPLTVEAIKEQQTQIGEQSSQISGISNSQFLISNQIQNINDQTVGMDDKLKIISNSLASLDSRTTADKTDITDLKTRLAAAETKLAEAENNLATFEASVNDTLAAMLETENMLTEKILSHEDRIKALEDKVSTLTVSGGGDIPANIVTQDATGNVTLAGLFKSKQVEADGIVAGDIDAENLKLGTQSSGKNKIKSGEKEVEIKTSEVNADSKIYITLTGSSFGKILYVDEKKIEAGKSFIVTFDGEPAEKDITFNWLIVN